MKKIIWIAWVIFLFGCGAPENLTYDSHEYGVVGEQAKLEMVHELLESKGSGSVTTWKDIEQKALENISEEKLDSLIDTLFDDEGE